MYHSFPILTTILDILSVDHSFQQWPECSWPQKLSAGTSLTTPGAGTRVMFCISNYLLSTYIIHTNRYSQTFVPWDTEIIPNLPMVSFYFEFFVDVSGSNKCCVDISVWWRGDCLQTQMFWLEWRWWRWRWRWFVIDTDRKVTMFMFILSI